MTVMRFGTLVKVKVTVQQEIYQSRLKERHIDLTDICWDMVLGSGNIAVKKAVPS